MKSRCPVALLILLLCALPASAQEQAAALRFAWPAKSRCVVDVHSLKGGRSVKLRHFVRLDTEKNGERRLRFVKTQPLEMNGQDLRSPQVRAAMGAELAKLRGIQPDLRLSADGQFIGVIGVERAVERWLDLVRNSGPMMEEAEIDALRARVLARENRAALEAQASQFWKLWVGVWRGAALAEGQTVEGSTSIPVGARRVEAETTLRHKGESEGDVHLTLTVDLAGEPARAAFEALLGSFDPQSKPQVSTFRRTTRFEVLTNPETLQPRVAVLEQIATLQVEGEKRTVRRERQAFTFRWQGE